MTNINDLVNQDNSHIANFSSTVVPGYPSDLPGLPGIKNNVDAAEGHYPNYVKMNGGYNKRKIKNISKKYKKMSRKLSRKQSKRISKRQRRKTKNVKKTKLSRNKRNLTRRKQTRKRKQRGGNSLPSTASYSVGGVLSANELGLANPVPFTATSTCHGNTYNHYESGTESGGVPKQ